MPAVDLVAHIDGLWTDADENAALLLEWLAHSSTVEWQRLTVDPDAPEVVAQRQAAEASGVKPPSRPVVPPMARRPWLEQRRRIEAFADEVSGYEIPTEPPVDELDQHSFLATWVGQFA
jgi:hypothetical protein